MSTAPRGSRTERAGPFRDRATVPARGAVGEGGTSMTVTRWEWALTAGLCVAATCPAPAAAQVTPAGIPPPAAPTPPAAPGPPPVAIPAAVPLPPPGHPPEFAATGPAPAPAMLTPPPTPPSDDRGWLARWRRHRYEAHRKHQA